jgi:hypothetical protein
LFIVFSSEEISSDCKVDHDHISTEKSHGADCWKRETKQAVNQIDHPGGMPHLFIEMEDKRTINVQI